MIVGKGHIWPEYWIDCCTCDEAHPLAATKSPARAAIKQGYRRTGNTSFGPWACPKCVEDFKELQQVKAALTTSQRGTE